MKIDFFVAIIFPGRHIPTANLAVKLDAYAAQIQRKIADWFWFTSQASISVL
jgi:hypothetical protein